MKPIWICIALSLLLEAILIFSKVDAWISLVISLIFFCACVFTAGMLEAMGSGRVDR